MRSAVSSAWIRRWVGWMVGRLVGSWASCSPLGRKSWRLAQSMDSVVGGLVGWFVGFLGRSPVNVAWLVFLVGMVLGWLVG